MPSNDSRATKETQPPKGNGSKNLTPGTLSGPSREESDRSTIEHSLAVKRYSRLGRRSQ
jgi:hypothetical protein